VRLIGLTNFYPPLGYGYGAICRDVMQELQARGHRSTVLCADGGTDGPLEVRLGLAHVPAAWRRPIAGLRGEAASQRIVRAALAEGVDAALIWHMRGIGKGSLALLHEAGIPVIYLLGDLWVIYERPGPPATWPVWPALDHLAPYRALRNTGSRMLGMGRVELGAPPIEWQGVVCFASRWLQERYAEAGFRPRHGHVVPNGIRIEDFAGPRDDFSDPLMRVLFAGRVDPGKGADLAVGAIADVDGARLVLAGGGERSSVQAIADQVARLGLQDRVERLGEVSRERVAELMRASDVLVMPGRFPDAFGLVYVEAMAAGAVVVGTAKGGAAEICRDGENALVVGDDGPAELAAALRRLRDEPALRERLRVAGTATAQRYSLGAMVDRVEQLLS
jgi:glycosyltransferase involved in cell wall biosynthesis